MKVIQLHDKFTEEIIGSILALSNSYDVVCEKWDLYQQDHNSNLDNEADIREFKELHGDDLFETIEIDFYQP